MSHFGLNNIQNSSNLREILATHHYIKQYKFLTYGVLITLLDKIGNEKDKNQRSMNVIETLSKEVEPIGKQGSSLVGNRDILDALHLLGLWTPHLAQVGPGTYLSWYSSLGAGFDVLCPSAARYYWTLWFNWSFLGLIRWSN